MLGDWLFDLSEYGFDGEFRGLNTGSIEPWLVSSNCGTPDTDSGFEGSDSEGIEAVCLSAPASRYGSAPIRGIKGKFDTSLDV